MPRFIWVAAAIAFAAAPAIPALAQQAAPATAAAPTATVAAATPVPVTGGRLRIATSPGAYGEAQKLAVFDPFTKDTGTQIDTSANSGSANDWDVADLSAAEASDLCAKGQLEPIDPASLKAAPDGSPASADFLPGGLDKCAVGSLAWSSVILYLAEGKDAKTGKTAPVPKTLKDFFDPVHFPGKRGLPRDPRYVLELALMADGVFPQYVYTQLALPLGRARALRSLASIRSQIVFWDTPQQSLDLLKSRTVTMTLGYSGRAFMEIATGTKPIKILWDRQIYDVDVWAVSKAARNKSGAMQFVAYASGTDRLAATARQLPYGPMRRSAVSLVGAHPILGTDLKPFLPTSPDNMATALQIDGSFWREHHDEVAELFNDWVDYPPFSAGVGKDVKAPAAK